jgi:hypothetical protein
MACVHARKPTECSKLRLSIWNKRKDEQKETSVQDAFEDDDGNAGKSCAGRCCKKKIDPPKICMRMLGYFHLKRPLIF